jgi:hypothetical protein
MRADADTACVSCLTVRPKETRTTDPIDLFSATQSSPRRGSVPHSHCRRVTLRAARMKAKSVPLQSDRRASSVKRPAPAAPSPIGAVVSRRSETCSPTLSVVRPRRWRTEPGPEAPICTRCGTHLSRMVDSALSTAAKADPAREVYDVVTMLWCTCGLTRPRRTCSCAAGPRRRGRKMSTAADLSVVR